MNTNVFPVSYEEAILSKEIVKNPTSTYNEQKFNKQKDSHYKEEQLLSLSEYAEMFITSFHNIVTKQKQFLGSMKFEKDDPYCMKFVYAATSLRTYNFLNSVSPSNKH